MKNIKITEAQANKLIELLSKNSLNEDVSNETEILKQFYNRLNSLKQEFNLFWKEKDINYNEFTPIEKDFLQLEKDFNGVKNQLLDKYPNDSYYDNLETATGLEKQIQELGNKIHDFSIIVDKAVAGLKQFINFPFEIKID